MMVPDVANVISSEWAGALGSQLSPSADDEDFFDVGGNSLLAVALLERLEERLGSAPPIELFFTSPFRRTLEEFYDVVRTDARSEPGE